jgi:hypothetical protein
MVNGARGSQNKIIVHAAVNHRENRQARMARRTPRGAGIMADLNIAAAA